MSNNNDIIRILAFLEKRLNQVARKNYHNRGQYPEIFFELEGALCAAPWFSVSEHDVFPEEFQKFLGLPPFLMDALKERHGDLFEVDFWRQTQDALNE